MITTTISEITGLTGSGPKLVLQSDIGIICKSSGEEEYVVYTTDLLSARPKGGCKVRAYDKQNQTLAEASTDSEGRAVLKCREEPSIVAAEATDSSPSSRWSGARRCH